MRAINREFVTNMIPLNKALFKLCRLSLLQAFRLTFSSLGTSAPHRPCSYPHFFHYAISSFLTRGCGVGNVLSAHPAKHPCLSPEQLYLFFTANSSSLQWSWSWSWSLFDFQETSDYPTPILDLDIFSFQSASSPNQSLIQRSHPPPPPQPYLNASAAFCKNGAKISRLTPRIPNQSIC